MYVCIPCCIVVHEHYLTQYFTHIYYELLMPQFYHGNATYVYSSSYNGGVMGVLCMHSVLWKNAYCIYVCTLVVHASNE